MSKHIDEDLRCKLLEKLEKLIDIWHKNMLQQLKGNQSNQLKTTMGLNSDMFYRIIKGMTQDLSRRFEETPEERATRCFNEDELNRALELIASM